MNKKEILEKSRQSGSDEGMRNAENKGRSFGYIAFVILSVILLGLSLFFWQPITLYAVQSLFWTFIATEGFSKYAFNKKIRHLLLFLSSGAAAILSFIQFIKLIVV